MNQASKEKLFPIVHAVEYFRGIDASGNSVRIAPADVVTSDKWYGVEWDITSSSPECTRIGNMEMHRTLPIQNSMRGCLLSDSGAVNQYLNGNTWAGQDRTGASGQVQVEVDNFYIRCETDGNIRRCMMSETPLPGFFRFQSVDKEKTFLAPYFASLDRNTYKLCSVVNTTAAYRGGGNQADWDNTWRSQLGRPVTGVSREYFRQYARNRGNGTHWNAIDYTGWCMLTYLMIVEYATLNLQKPYNAALDANGFHQGGLGPGVSEMPGWDNYGYNPIIPNGASDSLGNNSGVVTYNVLGSDNSVVYAAPVNRYRGIEMPYGHLYHWVDGINIQETGSAKYAWVATDPANFNGANYDGHINRGALARDNGYIKNILWGPYGDILATEVGGGSTTYYCDYNYNSNAVGLYGGLFGWLASSGAYCGPFGVHSTNAPSYATAFIASRLRFIP